MSKRRISLILLTLLVVMLLLTSCGAPTTTDPNAPPDGIWQSVVVYPLASALMWIHNLLESIGIPYSYGFSIILFTIFVKVITIPLTRQQLRSMKAMQDLQPRLQELQKKHGKDRQALQEAQMALYRENGVNPMGGCLPLVIQMPILFGLYQALFHLASIGELKGQHFLWLQDLSFPNQAAGLQWITDFFNQGQYFLLIGYLILPVFLVLTQIMLQKMSQPKATGQQDPQQAAMGQMMLFMPLIFGFVFISLPSGLSLYYVTSNILSMIQQYFVTGWGSLNLPNFIRRGAISAQNSADDAKITPVTTTQPTQEKPQGQRRSKKRK